MCPTNWKDSFPTQPLSLCNWGGKLDFGVNYEVIVSSNIESPSPRIS